MQLELDKQFGREREMSKDSREERGQFRSKHNAWGNAALWRSVLTMSVNQDVSTINKLRISA